MFESWRFSKGTLLTVLATALTTSVVLGVAYHLHHYSEILSGVIGGLTIILGMITAEWLRSSREKVEETRLRYEILDRLWDRCMFNAEEFFDSPFLEVNAQLNEDFNKISHTIILMARTTRWPQPNAKKIREQATELDFQFRAFLLDALERKHVWSLQRRASLWTEFTILRPLIWDITPAEQEVMWSRISSHRETEKIDDIPTHWSPERRRDP